jgi:hypothetical protein
MLLIHQKRNNFLWLIQEIIKEIFKISLISYLLFYLVENFKAGFISDYFNLNILLIITIISGVLTVGGKKEVEEREVKKIKVKDYVFIIVLGAVAAGLIYYSIKEIGKLAYLISIVSGVIVILISILLLNDSFDDEEND